MANVNVQGGTRANLPISFINLPLAVSNGLTAFPFTFHQIEILRLAKFYFTDSLCFILSTKLSNTVHISVASFFLRVSVYVE